jgi:hypothetical protein
VEFNITLTTRDIVAWWGAVIATVVLIWDIYKWKTSGPKLKFKVSPNMIVVGDPTREGTTFISATNLVIQHYTNYFNMLRNKPSTSMIVKSPSTVQPLPFILQPGQVWQGLAIQNEEFEILAKDGYLVCGLCHSHSDKEIDRRIKINKK